MSSSGTSFSGGFTNRQDGYIYQDPQAPIASAPNYGFVHQGFAPEQPQMQLADREPRGVSFINADPPILKTQNGPIHYGRTPIYMTCPGCQSQIRTSIRSSPASIAWIVGGVLGLVGCIPCACIPCFLDNMQNKDHNCPSCQMHLGRFYC
ncbi:LITAF [Lepeophtheirus salmonis]|uniref:LITAF n=1 Tax=Lepeophtheirus salmonis TaxID=72036 RepID=A0A7R8H235_LEPSM|nr:LITAF [Lepeophtheirus salmonis]CAF2806285.1 LITAF [Lepeophtheirus salmonis]